jgi:hypothetical protein
MTLEASAACYRVSFNFYLRFISIAIINIISRTALDPLVISVDLVTVVALRPTPTYRTKSLCFCTPVTGWSQYTLRH